VCFLVVLPPHNSAQDDRVWVDAGRRVLGILSFI
jgi:hypothetical protein